MLIKDAALIPDWLKEELEENCPFCGTEYQVGYSPNNSRVTKHYCPNKECPATLAMKMSFVWTILGVDGIKYGKSLELVKTHKIRKHLDGIPYILKDVPDIDVVTFMRLNCIQGVDGTWGSICAGKETLQEVIDTPSAQRFLTPDDVEDVMSASKYFNIIFPKKQKYESVLKITIMMTGDIMGLESRELLVMALNEKYKGLLELGYSKSKRKTGVYALVKEDNSPVTGKVTTAIESGIPIMNPSEFILRIDKLIKERLGDNIGNYDI